MASADIAEGLPIGEKARSAGRTISEGEFALLTDLTWTTGELHTNKEYGAHETSFGERLLGGPIVAALVASLASNTTALHRALHETYGVRTVAAMGIAAQYHTPVKPGDTLWADTWIDSIRPSKSRPGQAILTARDDGFNQNDELVIEVTRTLLVERG